MSETTQKSDILLVKGGNPNNLQHLLKLLNEEDGYSLRVVRSGSEAIHQAYQNPPDLILLDMLFPDMDGYTVCKRLKEDPKTEFIPLIFLMDSGGEFQTEDIARVFMNGGADYIGNPIIREELLARVNAHLGRNLLQRQFKKNRALHTGLDHRDRLGELVGGSPSMQQVYNRIMQAAASDDIVVIYGETGTGKELAARTIFELSRRSASTFITVNCGAVQESLFESMFFGRKRGAFTGSDSDSPGFFEWAHEGVLFLDEVGELTPTMQAKLLRVLQDGEFIPVGACGAQSGNVRIISATHRNLMELVKDGRMRADFFQRIHVIPIEMPSLRNHKEDISLLVDHFLRETSARGLNCQCLPDQLMAQLMAYDWPGNVRELFNELRRFLAIGEIELNGTYLKATEKIPEGLTYHELMKDFERKLLREALFRYEGNRSRTAQALAIPRKTLQRKIKKFNL